MTGAVFKDDPNPGSSAGRPPEPRVCHHTQEPTVLSMVSCRPFHFNIDRFHQPCLLPGRTSRIGEDCRFPVPRGGHLPFLGGQHGSSSFASHWRFLPRRQDGTTARRLFILPPLHVPPRGRRCLHTQVRDLCESAAACSAQASHAQSCRFTSFQNTRKFDMTLFDTRFVSNFLRAFFMVSLNSLSSGSTK